MYGDRVLHVMTQQNGWQLADMADPRYGKIHREVSKLLLHYLQTPVFNDSALGPPFPCITSENNDVTTTLLGVNRQRAGIVIMCTQRTRSTDGMRFMCYGMDYMDNCDYGIGLSLSNMDSALLLKRRPHYDQEVALFV